MKKKKKMNKKIHGDFPEFGAIFMSNLVTMEECLEKKLFGLPSFNADFVKKVRAGMILFLFEYERRKLYGVFQATTDGQMNVVPHAYSSTGKQFPAQVRFSTVWECDPLCEAEFRDAIWENYYDRYKFLLGLSQNQVTRLLWLFESKRLETESSQMLSCGMKRIRKYPSGDREMETEGSIFRRKLSSGISVVSYQKLESSPCDHIGDHEPCCFDSSEVPGIRVSSYKPESKDSKFEEEKERSKDPPKDGTDLGDFIPLPSPNNSDCEAESFELHLPQMLRSSAIPSRNTDDCPLKEGTQSLIVCGNTENHLPIKSLYSDVEGEKSSVFSRLNFGSKDFGREKGQSFGEKTRGHNSVQDIMGTSLQSRSSWRKNNAKDKSFKRGDVAPAVKRSVFSRLSWVSKSAEQENVSTIWLQKDYRGNEKVRRAKVSFHEGEGNYKSSRTVEQWPEALVQNGYWSKAREREVSNQNLGNDQYSEESSFTGKVLKRHGQTEESFEDGSRSKCKLEQPPRRKLVRPLFKMPSEFKTITSENYDKQMPSKESSADRDNIGNCEVPITGNAADEKIDTTVLKETQPVLGPLQCKGNNREAESNITDRVSKSEELVVGGFNARGVTTTTPLKVYSRRAKNVEVYSISVA